jgi:hypothetical protein
MDETEAEKYIDELFRNVKIFSWQMKTDML